MEILLYSNYEKHTDLLNAMQEGTVLVDAALTIVGSPGNSSSVLGLSTTDFNKGCLKQVHGRV